MMSYRLPTKRELSSLSAALAAWALCACGHAAHAQAPRPHLTGVWMAARPVDGDPQALNAPIAPAPLNAHYKALYQAEQAAFKTAEGEGRPLAHDREVCIPDGVSKMLSTDFPVEILETSGQVTVITELMAQVRRIDLTRKDHPQGDDLEPGFFGDAIGAWTGDVLTTDTVGLKPRTRLFLDVPHSASTRVLEQLSLLRLDLLEDRLTITDSEAFTGPWVVVRKFVRQPKGHVGEFLCEENNPYYKDAAGRLALRRQ